MSVRTGTLAALWQLAPIGLCAQLLFTNPSCCSFFCSEFELIAKKIRQFLQLDDTAVLSPGSDLSSGDDLDHCSTTSDEGFEQIDKSELAEAEEEVTNTAKTRMLGGIVSRPASPTAGFRTRDKTGLLGTAALYFGGGGENNFDENLGVKQFLGPQINRQTYR